MSRTNSKFLELKDLILKSKFLRFLETFIIEAEY